MKAMRCQLRELSDSFNKISDTYDTRSSFVWKDPEKHSTSIVFDGVFYFPINWTSVRRFVKEKVPFLIMKDCH